MTQSQIIKYNMFNVYGTYVNKITEVCLFYLHKNVSVAENCISIDQYVILFYIHNRFITYLINCSEVITFNGNFDYYEL